MFTTDLFLMINPIEQSWAPFEVKTQYSCTDRNFTTQSLKNRWTMFTPKSPCNASQWLFSKCLTIENFTPKWSFIPIPCSSNLNFRNIFTLKTQHFLRFLTAPLWITCSSHPRFFPLSTARFSWSHKPADITLSAFYKASGMKQAWSA